MFESGAWRPGVLLLLLPCSNGAHVSLCVHNWSCQLLCGPCQTHRLAVHCTLTCVLKL